MSKRLIYAEDAIDALMEILDRPNHAEFLYTDEICKALEELPSAQPQIIRCRDCKHYHYADSHIPQEQMCTCEIDGNIWSPDSYCSFAERRTNGVDN